MEKTAPKNFQVGEAPRILIVLHGAIGDVVRALPLAMRIKKFLPRAHLTWAVESLCAPLVMGHPAVDRVEIFERARGFSAYLSFIGKLRREQYDICLDLQRHLKSGVTALLSGAKERLGFSRANSREGNWLFSRWHIPAQSKEAQKIWHFQAFADFLGLAPAETLEFGLEATRQEREKLAQLIRTEARCPSLKNHENFQQANFVALLLGSTWKSRLWPVRHYARCAEEFYRKRGLKAMLVGSAGEQQMANELEAQLSPEICVNLVGKTTLRDLVPLFSFCRFAIGPDSGPMHLAAAVQLAVVSLWGPTDSRRSAPYGFEKYLIQSPIACSPCGRRECPGLGGICLSELSPQAVIARVETMIDAGVVVL